MKRSKLFAITLQSKTRLIFFFVLAAYNLLLGIYLKDFFEISPMLVTFYLLSALPTLFFVMKIWSTPMRAIVFIVLFFVMVWSYRKAQKRSGRTFSTTVAILKKYILIRDLLKLADGHFRYRIGL